MVMEDERINPEGRAKKTPDEKTIDPREPYLEAAREYFRQSKFSEAERIAGRLVADYREATDVENFLDVSALNAEDKARARQIVEEAHANGLNLFYAGKDPKSGNKPVIYQLLFNRLVKRGGDSAMRYPITLFRDGDNERVLIPE